MLMILELNYHDNNKALRGSKSTPNDIQLLWVNQEMTWLLTFNDSMLNNNKELEVNPTFVNIIDIL